MRGCWTSVGAIICVFGNTMFLILGMDLLLSSPSVGSLLQAQVVHMKLSCAWRSENPVVPADATTGT